jgi:hypothetical protein
MSERKSWDVQPKRREAPQAPAPIRQKPQPKVVRRAAPAPSGTLKERRKRKRIYARYVFLSVLFLIILVTVYALWRPALRVWDVSATGPGAEAAQVAAQSYLSGTYYHLIPRNSVFFLPEDGMRAAVLEAVPEASAVSLSRTSFTSVAISTIPRASSFTWCGIAISAPTTDGACYAADIEGFIFKRLEQVQPVAATSTESKTQGQVRFFAPIDRELAGGELPLRARVAAYAAVPDALKFVDTIRELGAPITDVSIQGDEAELWYGGAKILYVLGREGDAALLAASAFPALKLTDGTIQYIDLRFPGKAYIKRYGE